MTARHYGFLLLPDFPLLAFASALEPLRIANRLSAQTLYRWSLLSRDDEPVAASNGMRFCADLPLADAGRLDALFLLAGLDVQRYCDEPTRRALRRLARGRPAHARAHAHAAAEPGAGTALGAISIASVILARAGLLDGYRCTIHWENLDSFIDEFPAAIVSAELFEIDRGRMTCSGGTAALDMMLYLIRVQHSRELAAAVAEQCIHPQIRAADERQRMDLRTRLDVAHPKLLKALARMQLSLDEPLAGAELAAAAGVTLRQLERLFRLHLDTTPKRYYLQLRLLRAQRLLGQSSLSVVDVAAACGFSSASYFATCYRRRFGYPPRRERSSGRE